MRGSVMIVYLKLTVLFKAFLVNGRLNMKRTITKCILSVLALMLCVPAFFACASAKESVSIVITNVEKDNGDGTLLIDGYSISDKREFRFKLEDSVVPSEEPAASNVVKITYKTSNESKEAIPAEAIDILSKDVFTGRIAFIKGLGACLIGSVDGAYELNPIKGLGADRYNAFKPGDSVVVYVAAVSENKTPVTIRASYIELAVDTESRTWNQAERDILEKYDTVDSYAEAQYETPLGDRASSDPQTAELLALTDAKVKEKYGIGDLGNYSVSISEHASEPQKDVTYVLYLGGHRTYEEYIVRVNDNGTVIDCSAINEGKYSRFLSCFTVEKLQAAEEKLKNELSKYGSGPIYLTLNSDGQLCLSFEAIVSIDPPKIRFFDGQFVSSGCDIDHKHVFGSEVICGTEP